jgi:hypothetical protein
VVSIKAPELSTSKKNDWVFTFVGLRESRGTIHDDGSLATLTVSISPTFAIQVTENAFSNNNEIIHDQLN